MYSKQYKQTKTAMLSTEEDVHVSSMVTEYQNLSIVEV